MEGILPTFHNEKEADVARKGISMRKAREILRLKHALGLTNRQLGSILKTSHVTVGTYLKHAEAAAIGWPRLLIAGLAAPFGVAVMWSAVAHLGRQFRINAGLYADHELVRTGPYAVVRHPIYASMSLMLVATAALLTRWEWAVASAALFVIGTEIRVRTEDRLLASRFGERFAEYRREVAAYVPFLR